MRVTLETDGGFAAIPGLRRTVTVDGAALPAAARAQLAALVRDPAALGATAPASGAARDARSYVLTIHDDHGRQHALRFADPVAAGPLRELRDLVTHHGTPAKPG